MDSNILKFGPGKKDFFPVISTGFENFLYNYDQMNIELLQGSLGAVRIIKPHKIFFGMGMPTVEYTDYEGYPLALHPPKYLREPKQNIAVCCSNYVGSVGKQKVRLLFHDRVLVKNITDNADPNDDTTRKILETAERIEGFVVPESLEFTINRFGGDWLSASFIIETDFGAKIKIALVR